MKSILICILLLPAAMSISAQSVTYSYDNAGNRKARVVTPPMKNAQASQTQETTMRATARQELLRHR